VPGILDLEHVEWEASIRELRCVGEDCRSSNHSMQTRSKLGDRRLKPRRSTALSMLEKAAKKKARIWKLLWKR
jgi:hypothetical protein